MAKLNNNQIQQIIETYEKYNSISKTVAELGHDKNTIKKHLNNHGIKTDEASRLQREVDKAEQLKNIIEKSGMDVKLGWLKSGNFSIMTKFGDINFEKQIEALLKKYNKIKIPLANFKKEKIEKELMFLPLYDLHFGKAGNELEVYREQIIKRINNIDVKVNKCCLVLGQDVAQADNKNNTTSNGTLVEKNQSFDDMIEDAVSFYIEILQMLSKKSKAIDVIYSSGNHDDTVSKMLFLIIKASFKGDRRIKFLDDKTETKDYIGLEKRAYYHYNGYLLGIAHGDLGKKRLPFNMAIETHGKFGDIHPFNKSWELGHLHQKLEERIDGIQMVTHPSPCDKDVWHHKNGFISNTQFNVVFINPNNGERTTHTFNVNW